MRLPARQGWRTLAASRSDPARNAVVHPAPGQGAPRRSWSARDGAVAIEMAFLLPVFLLMLVGIEEFGRALWIQTSLQFACEKAARCAAVSPGQCTAPGGTTINVPAYAASQAFGVTVPASAFTYKANQICGTASSTGTGGAEVDASYRFQSVAAGLLPSLASITLTAKSCHP
jgi:Flp pilus assembly protein TadG